jgi:hypothetical protein
MADTESGLAEPPAKRGAKEASEVSQVDIFLAEIPARR